MKVELIRHGDTDLMAEHRYQGITDAHLTEEGREKLLPSARKIQLLIVTGLARSQETAEGIFPGIEQHIVEELGEMNFGIFEGRNFIEMEEDAAYRSWVESGCLSQCPGGESKAEFCERICEAFTALLDQAQADAIEEIAIVAHGGTQMAVMEAFCKEEEKPFYEWQQKSGCGYLLEAESWQEKREVRILELTDYNRG